MRIRTLCGAILVVLSLQLAGQEYQARLTGFRQLSEFEVGFEIQVRNAIGPLPWAYNAGQYQVVFNSLSLRGGILKGATMETGSRLPVGQQIAEEDIFWAPLHNALTLSAPAMAAGSHLMLIDQQEWLTITPLVVRLQDGTGSTFIPFADVFVQWGLRQAGTRIFAADYYLEDALARRGEGPGRPGYSRQLTSAGLVAIPLSRQLAGCWFYGEGKWNDADHWNVALRTISPGWQQQLPGEAGNVQVAGQVTLPGEFLVNLQPATSGHGGQLVVGDAMPGQAPPSLTIAPLAGLKVSQLFNDQAAEAINIQASAAGSGWLIHDNEEAQARVECYMNGPSGLPQAFRLISSPVQNHSLAEFVATVAGQKPFIWKWMPHSASWEPADLEHATCDPGHGYRVAVTQEEVAAFSGVLTTEDVVLNGLNPDSGPTANGHDGGWHLLGNPFASPLSWNTGQWQLSNICHTAQVWDDQAGSYRLLHQGHQAVIGVTEGFFVHVEQGNPGSLIIPAAARLHDPAAGQDSLPPGEQVMLTASYVQQGLVQPTIIGFNGAATPGYDITHDAPFLEGEAPLFYSVSAGRKLALNTLPEVTAQLVVPLGFEAHAAGSYAIDLQQGLAGVPLTLFDRQLQVWHALAPGRGYAFGAAPGDPAERFELHFAAAPVSTMGPEELGTLITLSGSRLCITRREAAGGQLALYAMDGSLLLERPLGALPHQCLAVALPRGVYVVVVRGPRGAVSRVVVRR